MPSVNALVLEATLIMVPALVAAVSGWLAWRLRHRPGRLASTQLASALLLFILGLVTLKAATKGIVGLIPFGLGLAMLAHFTLNTQLFAGVLRAVPAAVGVLAAPRHWGLLLVALTPFLLTGGVWHFHAMTAPTTGLNFEASELPAVNLDVDSSVTAVTDRGVRVPLYRCRGISEGVLDPEEGEGTSAAAFPLPYRAVRLAAHDPSSNCAGWVFADGQHWILCQDVPVILKDNGYRPVDVPAQGDLIVYRDNAGAVAHVARVHALLNSNRPLIESKWDSQGVVLHLPEATPHGNSFHYYRTSRPGHSLAVTSPGEQNSRSAAEATP